MEPFPAPDVPVAGFVETESMETFWLFMAISCTTKGGVA
jgi:hypothetical protein